MRPNAKCSKILRWGIFLVFIVISGTLSSLYAEQKNDHNSILETIVQGVSYRDSLIKGTIKSATINFHFEKYSRAMPGSPGDSFSNKGEARFVIKDNKMRLDMDYKQTIYAGSVDPHGEGGKSMDIKVSHYHSPNSLQTLDKLGKKLIIEKLPSPSSIFPFSFGLNWSCREPNFEVKLFGDILSNLMKQGVLRLGGEEVLEGTKCYVLERTYPDGGGYKWWIAPSKGYSVMRTTITEVVGKGNSKRELITFERVCAVKNITGDIWLPVSGVERYYTVDPSSKTIEDLKLYIERETRIEVTGYELNKVSDNEVTPPDFNSGEYNVVDDKKTGQFIRLKNNPNTKN